MRRASAFKFLLPLVLVLAALAAPASAAAADRNWLVPNVTPAASPDVLPRGYEITPRQAVRAALRDARVRAELARRPGMTRSVEAPGYTGEYRWAVGWADNEGRKLEVHVDGASGRVVEVWTGIQVDWILARGYDPPIGGNTFSAAWVWIPLCLLFIAPFFDPRRPFRLLHLDLLMLVGFGLSHMAFNDGEVGLSVPLVYPFLLYLLGRLLFAGLRPRPRAGRIVPLAPAWLLAVGLVLLVGFRIGLNVTDSGVIDVGFASVIGADRITHGEELYTDNDVHGDTYGPFTYIAYVPFEALFPFANSIEDVPAAQAAAITFDLLTLLGLLVLGTRLRGGREGRLLGLALAFAWAAYPYSTFALVSNVNDALVAALLVAAMIGLTSAPARGAMLALGTAAKFAPLALAPLFAAGTGDRRPRSVAAFAAALALVVVACVLAYLPDGGLAEFWNATLGFQLGRESPFSIWGQNPGLAPAKVAISGVTLVSATALFFVPRRRDARQVAALAGAVLVALQLGAEHWFYYYLVWVAPLAFVAIFCAYRSEERAPDPPAREAARTPEPALA